MSSNFGFNGLFFVVPIFIGIVFIAVIVGVILTIIKAFKSHISASKTIEVFGKEIYKRSVYNAETNSNQEKIDKTIYCDYCGSIIKKDDTKCNSCGAKYTNK